MNKLNNRYLFLLFIVFLMSSCSYVQEHSQPTISTLFPTERDHIKTIAILPFMNNTDWEFRMRAGVEEKMFNLTKRF